MAPMPAGGPGGNALSPLDGRYATAAAPLAALLSERAYIARRHAIELEWLRELAATPGSGLELSAAESLALAGFQVPSADQVAAQVVEIEQRTRHDVKAVELALARDLAAAGLGRLAAWVHFGCTSWDINNLAYGLMVAAARTQVLVPALRRLQATLAGLATANAALPMLARTHGQPASPTTLGKEFAVHAQRVTRLTDQLAAHVLDGKFNGAVGNHNALVAAAPAVDWRAVTRAFVERLGLACNEVTTQVEPYESLVELFDTIARTNRVLADLAQDLSLYTGMGYLTIAVRAGETGSSTMPHKVNPIAFENAEGNLAVANALLGSFGRELQVSRLQRDLSDSTVLRNVGVALGHALVAWEALATGLADVTGDAQVLAADLDANWQVLGEAVQTVLRAQGDAQAYDRLRDATRGRGHLDREGYLALVRELVPAGPERERLLALTPATYLGLAARLARDAGETASQGQTGPPPARS